MKLLNILIFSKALDAAHIESLRKDFNTSGIGEGVESTFPKIKCSTSWFVSSSDLNNIRRVSMAPTMILCLSNKPLLVF